MNFDMWCYFVACAEHYLRNCATDEELMHLSRGGWITRTFCKDYC